MITAFLRTVILYFLIMVGLRLTGKRQIGELEPGELVLTMMISDLASVPMQDFGIPLLCGIIPILTLLSISLLLSQISLRSVRFRRLLCGSPTVLIRNGVLQQEAMQKNRYTNDELMEELRCQGYGDPSSVKFAVLENSGELSILPWPEEQPPTAKQLGLSLEDDLPLPQILINDGHVLQQNLRACGRNEEWLRKLLRRSDLSDPRDVFLLTYGGEDHIFLVPKEAVK